MDTYPKEDRNLSTGRGGSAGRLSPAQLDVLIRVPDDLSSRRKVLSDGQAQSSWVGSSRPPTWSGCVGGFIKRVTVNGSHVRVTAGQFGHPRLTGSRGTGAALDTKEPGAGMPRVGPGASGSPDTLLSPLI